MTNEPTPLSKADIEAIALALPEVELGTSWGDVPTFLVRGKGFILFRGPSKDALDPDTGEPMDDVIVVHTANAMDAAALIQSDMPFFTTAHFGESPSTALIRERDLPQLDYVELAEVITDAWAARAPRKLVKEHLG